MADLRPDPGSSHPGGKVAVDRTRDRGSRQDRNSGPSSGTSPLLWAVLDRLGDAAAAHDGELPAPDQPA